MYAPENLRWLEPFALADWVQPEDRDPKSEEFSTPTPGHIRRRFVKGKLNEMFGFPVWLVEVSFACEPSSQPPIVARILEYLIIPYWRSYIFQNFMVLAFKGTKTWLILFIYIAFNIFYSLLRLTVCYCMLCTNVFHRKK